MEIVFSDSAAGSMKMAQKYDAKAMSGSTIGYIGESEPTEAEINKHVAGEAMGGNSEEVLTIGFQLDIGNVAGAVDSMNRWELYQKMNPFYEMKDINEMFQQLRKNEEVLLESAQQGIPICVWRSNAPFSACGFIYVCHLLQGLDCLLSVVDMPEFIETDTGTLVQPQMWEDLPAGQLHRFTKLAREVTPLEKTIHSQTWQTLQAENSSLRAVVNGKVISVPEHFYDHLIEKEMPTEDFLLRELIGKLFSYELGVGDAWFASRIEKMIAAGKLRIINNQHLSHPYEKRLRRV